MKFSDFVAEKLSAAGIDFVAGVTGGGIVHLLHSMEKISSTTVIYTHHEQAAAYAAEAYTRINKRGACFVTTGPGGTNAITGLASAWLDSIPVIFISGQARSFSLTGPETVRQIGSQHFDIISVVKSITKYARTIRNLQEAETIIDEAIFAAFSGRPGPVWIDIPLDFQEIDFEPSHETIPNISIKSATENQELSSGSNKLKSNILIEALNRSERPLFVLGYGTRLSNTHERLIQIAESHMIPVALTWNTLDMLPSQHELNVGLLGVNGMRCANLAVAASDCVVAFGSHLSLQLTGPEVKNFAPNAKVYVVDIDPLEVKHLHHRFIGMEINLLDLIPKIESESLRKHSDSSWIKRIIEIKDVKNFGLSLEPQKNCTKVNQFYFYKAISSLFKSGDKIVIDGGGNVLFSSHQQLEFPEGTRTITGHGLGCMGSALPQSIGAAFASNPNSRIFCLIGDGSMQFNIQELATINFHNLPITIVIINNDGYLAIKNTQDTFFDRRFGVDAESGIIFPSYEKIATAYDIPYFKLNKDEEVSEILSRSSNLSGPCIIEVFVHEDTPLLPRLGYKVSQDGTRRRSAIYEMDPPLDESTLKALLK